MKKLIIAASILFLGSTFPMTEMENSYGHIQAFFTIKLKESFKCNDCSMTEDVFREVDLIKSKLSSLSYVKASSFVTAYKNNKTISITSNHVCKEVKSFLFDEKFKNLGKDLMKTLLESNIGNADFVTIGEAYEIIPVAYIFSFAGVKHQIDNILLTDSKTDTCGISSNGIWGVPVKYAKEGCYYEKAYNISSTGGYYYPNAVSLREGYVNNIVKSIEVEDEVFENVMLYTLIVKPGSSGSAVFNTKGEVCGSVNLSFIKVDLSAGASYKSLYDFHLRLIGKSP